MPQLLGFAAAGAAGAGAAVGGAVATGLSAATVGGLGAAALQIGRGLLISAATNALFAPDVSAQNVAGQLAQPSTEPGYRHVYGECWAAGTPVAQPILDDKIYACYLLNSRPSSLTEIEITLDDRSVTFTGDPFDLSGPGAQVQSKPFDWDQEVLVRFWVGRGDQTAPPGAYLSEAPESPERPDLWLSTDAWRGRTVIWVSYRSGGLEDMAERYKSRPPILKAFGKWSKVYDPRIGAQDVDDETTWAWSDNHALCCLDAAMRNPIRAWTEDMLLMSSFEEGADDCDETVPLKSGGSEPRYRAGGTVLYGAEQREVEDILNPLWASGAADMIRIGGSLGYASGVYRAPTETITEFIDGELDSNDLVPNLPNQLRTSYLSVARGTDSASLEPYDIPGALAEDQGLPLPRNLSIQHCPSPTQAMRVQKIAAGRLRRQADITTVLRPEHFNLVPGATATVALPDALYATFNGVYEIVECNPTVDAIGQSGVALRIPVTMIAHDASIYAWTPATDEQDVLDEPFDGTDDDLAPPGPLSVTVRYRNTGGTNLPQITLEAAPSPSNGVIAYDWQIAEDGGAWQPGGSINTDVRNGSGNIFDRFIADQDVDYDLRIRARGSTVSAWVSLSGISVDLVMVAGDATAEGGQVVRFTGTAPDNPNVNAVIVFRNTTTDFGTAGGVVTLSASRLSTINSTRTNQPLGTQHYWLVPRTISGVTGTPSGPHTVTVT